jgi:1-deoxy-D-xylulose-5-phosphate synthase
VIMAPSDENECRQMLYTGFQYNGVAAVRYPRGSGTGALIEQKMQAIPIGTAEIKRPMTSTQSTQKIAILSFGSMLAACLEAGEKLDATVVNMRFVKPLDQMLIEKLAQDHALIVTVEENCVMGGAGSAVMQVLQAIQNRSNRQIKTLCLGLPDQFIEHGVHETMLAECGLDAEGIACAIAKVITQ